jgi:Na+-transporting NADH:ubiquinone oxidoreductase subunit NqrC
MRMLVMVNLREVTNGISYFQTGEAPGTGTTEGS